MVKVNNTHGSGLMIAGFGILVRGESGSGKSLLTLDMIEWSLSRQIDAFLIADDRLELIERDGGLLMQAPGSIAGKIELRGRGIVTRPHIAISPVNLVVDLVDKLERLVEEDQLETEIKGVKLPRCPVPKRGIIDPLHQRLLVIEALREHQIV